MVIVQLGKFTKSHLIDLKTGQLSGMQVIPQYIWLKKNRCWRNSQEAGTVIWARADDGLG